MKINKTYSLKKYEKTFTVFRINWSKYNLCVIFCNLQITLNKNKSIGDYVLSYNDKFYIGDSWNIFRFSNKQKMFVFKNVYINIPINKCLQFANHKLKIGESIKIFRSENLKVPEMVITKTVNGIQYD